MRLRLSPSIPADLEEIYNFIARDSPTQARLMLRALRSHVREIAKQPMLYRLRPELGVDVRLAPVGQYVILFRIYKDFVRIERIVHGNRELFSIMEEADPPIAH